MSDVQNSEDMIFKTTQTMIKHIVAEDDKYTKQIMRDYAQKQTKHTLDTVELQFLDEEVVDRIIELGIKAYLKERSEEK